MKPGKLLPALTLVTGLALASSAGGQNFVDWIASSGDFYADSNWDSGFAPGASDTAVINNGGIATIAATAGSNTLAGIRLGEIQGDPNSGHVIMNGGFLYLSGSPGDTRALIGFGTVQSAFSMNGGTIYFDGPEQFPGIDETTDSSAGVNNLDWEVGELGIGRFEMHSNAVFRAADDLKIAEAAAGNGSCLIDGNAIMSLGSGISISRGGTVTQEMTIAGNALADSGNSMGAGNPLGHTDEGYLTMAIGGGRAKLTIQDNAVLNIRCLTARQGVSIIIVKDHGQFHIFDVFRSTHTAQLAELRRNSSYGTDPTSMANTLTLQDDAVMTVNAATSVVDDPRSGLSIGGRRSPVDAGGNATLIVRDRALFRVEQDLALGDGLGATSDGTLKVVGPDAKVSIGGDLNLAYHVPSAAPTPGTGTVHLVITGPTQTNIIVAGMARISNGRLKVSLEGYQPLGGEIYPVLQAAGFDGVFLATDFSEAPLVAGLSWDMEYMIDKVLLKVVGTAVKLTITRSGNGFNVSWTGTGTLEVANDVTGSWARLEGQSSPYSVSLPSSHQFFRVTQP